MMSESAHAQLVIAKIESNDRKLDSMLELYRRRLVLANLSIGLSVILIAGSAMVGFISYTKLSNDLQDKSGRNAAQTACYHVVQAHFVVQIGDLADSNGRQLRGESPDPIENQRRVERLREARGPMETLNERCFRDVPDPTPLDGDPNK